MLGCQLTILNLWVVWFCISVPLGNSAESLPVKDFGDEVHSLGQVVVEGIVDNSVKFFNSEGAFDAINDCMRLDFIERSHLLLQYPGLVLLECLVLLLLLLELHPEVLNLQLRLLELLR